jgi:hypothetical protein
MLQMIINDRTRIFDTHYDSGKSLSALAAIRDSFMQHRWPDQYLLINKKIDAG